MEMKNNISMALWKKPRIRRVCIHTVIIPTKKDNSEAVVVVAEVVVEVEEEEEEDQEEVATAEVFLEERP